MINITKSASRFFWLGTAAAILSYAAPATADSYPSRPIRMIVPAAAGGLLDVTTRLVAQRMSEVLGVSIIVDNRPGGETMIGTQIVKSSPPDGYTILTQANGMTARPALYNDPGYDLLKDFAPVGPMIRAPFVMLVSPNGPKTLAEWTADARSKPDAFSFASGGIGTPQHVGAELLMQKANLKLLHVPYTGNGAAMPDVMAGRVSMIFDGYGSSAGYIKSQKLRALGVTSTTRLSALPNVPTIAEQGFPNFSYYFWLGVFAPAGTPKNVINKLSDALHQALANKDLSQRLRSEGSEPLIMSPAQFSDYLKLELTQMSGLMKEAGLPKR